MILALPICLFAFAGTIAKQPNFSAYSAPPSHTQRLAAPRLSNLDERRFKTLLRLAVTHGYGVVEGGTEHERPGPNFAGKYILVQWGCGSDCMSAALIDSHDGTVLALPHVPGSENYTSFVLDTGSADLRTILFRTNSRLIGIPSKANGQTYFYTLQRNQWRSVGHCKPLGIEWSHDTVCRIPIR